VAALALGAALVTAGCGDTQANRAAVVDGTVIPETEVQATMAEVNGMDPALLKDKLTPSSALTALIQGPVILDYLASKGVVVSETVAREDAKQRGIEDPSDGTLEVIRLANSLSTAQQNGALGQGEAVELTQKLTSLKVSVNPRYGTFDREQAVVGVTTPSWVTPYDAAK